MKIGRNDPCHCGSEKKFKHCHQKKNLKNNNQYILIGVFVIAIIVFFIIDSSANNQSNIVPSNTLTNTNNLFSKAKPSTPAPPGKVWSEEHGHWHDTPKNQNLPPNLINVPSRKKNTEKNNLTPESKVWDDNHGHYHNKK